MNFIFIDLVDDTWIIQCSSLIPRFFQFELIYLDIYIYFVKYHEYLFISVPFLSLLNELYFGSRSLIRGLFLSDMLYNSHISIFTNFSCNFYEMWNIAWLNTCMTHRQKKITTFYWIHPSKWDCCVC